MGQVEQIVLGADVLFYLGFQFTLKIRPTPVLKIGPPGYHYCQQGTVRPRTFESYGAHTNDRYIEEPLSAEPKVEVEIAPERVRKNSRIPRRR